MTDQRDDHHWMRRAAALAVRGIGLVEPNPPVGCILVKDGRVVAMGHHRCFGGPHAEAEALARAGDAAAGSTAYVTLEPCAHHGKTPPCADALIGAGVRRVVIARPDPSAEAGGGADRLRKAGVDVEVLNGPWEALDLTAPFVMRVREGRPWVIAKWAQTIDGRIATRTGESQWISNSCSRRTVHLWRGRMDAMLTAMGTVRADDPMMTARDVPVRRTARRVVLDRSLEISLDAKLLRTTIEAPVTIVTSFEAAESAVDKLRQIEQAGAEVVVVNEGDSSMLRSALKHLHEAHDASRVMVEAGAGLLGQLVREDLLDEARVFVAPLLMADAEALPAVAGLETSALAEAHRMRLAGVKRIGGDVLLTYRRG
jgi:diaminohydroxyphosphoribosylaminopyrimidine deaminase/5-amino-6-(5-phosphoribosylamino)uracil reductase